MILRQFFAYRAGAVFQLRSESESHRAVAGSRPSGQRVGPGRLRGVRPARPFFFTLGSGNLLFVADRTGSA